MNGVGSDYVSRERRFEAHVLHSRTELPSFIDRGVLLAIT